jgi:hypothetical protein
MFNFKVIPVPTTVSEKSLHAAIQCSDGKAPGADFFGGTASKENTGSTASPAKKEAGKMETILDK